METSKKTQNKTLFWQIGSYCPSVSDFAPPPVVSVFSLGPLLLHPQNFQPSNYMKA